jgi:hypothetical protein
MVAIVTGHDTEFIRRKMPLARCFQYRTIDFYQQGIKCSKPNASSSSGLKQII